MANILQVTPPPLNTDTQIQNSQQRLQNQAQNPAIHNLANPEVVNRADGQDTGQSGTATSEGALAGRVIDFQGTYANFLQALQGTQDLPQAISDILFGNGAMILFQHQEGLETVLEELFSSIEMENPEQLREFFENQQLSQVKFSGPFFNGLRAMLSENISEPLRQTIQDFVKSYASFTSSEHYLNQMETVAKDVGNLMLQSSRGEFQELLQLVDWEAAPGDTEENADVINNQIIPFLSKYISKTHDYGPVRSATMMFILYAVKYENGNKANLANLLNKLMKNGDFQLLFRGNPEEAWEKNIEQYQDADKVNRFSDLFSKFLLEGADGKAGAENVGKFQQVMNGLLVNESVYMPLLHVLLPFRYEGKDVMSEMWVDPDAGEERGGQGGKAMKLLLKFNIQSVGNFEMVTMMRDRRVDMQLYLPKELMGEQKKIEGNVSGILRRNGLSVANVGIFRKMRDLRLTDVFPNIRKAEKGVNIKV